MLMWKILLWVTIFYVFIWTLDKIVRKVKAKKYGRNINDNGNNGDSNDRAGDVGTDKQ